MPEISKEEFIISRLSNKIGQLETYIAELEFQNTYLMQELKNKDSDKEGSDGEEK